ncbi:MAG: hypothetical protein Q8920_07545 [Bacillota bacterium]|nr:hypothetical protein [Bacillota bacterium]
MIQNEENVNAIEFTIKDISARLNVNITFTITGISIPSISRKDCFEKNPEFFIENTIRYTIPVNIHT